MEAYGPADGRAFSFPHSDDIEGVKMTLALMRKLARESSRQADMVAFARERIRGVAERDWYGQIHALHNFVRDNILYVLDPVDMEVLATPEYILQTGMGDCDEKSTLLATLLRAVGHPVRFKAVGFQPGELSHVYVETRAGGFGGWIPLDTTEPVSAGELNFSPAAVRESWIVTV